MRKIISKHEKEKQERMKQLVVGGVLVVIMFASVFGYAFQDKNKDENSVVKHNGFEFIKKNSLWFMEDFSFKYNPEETKDFESTEDINGLGLYSNKPLYIYSENKGAETEIYKNLYPVVQRIQYACLNESFGLNCEKSWPIKTCEDNFILIQEGDFEIKQEDNCLFMQGQKEDLIKISDEVLFKIIGVRQ